MGAATVQAQIRTGSGSGSAANAEGGVSFSLDDSATGTTPVQIPTSTGTNYSWIRNLELHVTSTGTTTINNRTIKMSGSPSTGLKLHWKDVAVASYAQAASGNRPSSSGSDGATPSGYTNMTTSAVQYDNTSVATSSTGANGDMAVCVMGVDSSYSGGPGSAISLPSIILGYDEF
jgi:hypothetical protein